MKFTTRLCATSFLITQSIGLLAVPVFNPANGHYYDYVNGGFTWTQAKTTAEGMVYNGLSGHLVTIRDSAENSFVVSSFPTHTYDGNIGGVTTRSWLGGFQPASSSEPAGNWQWVTGEPMSFTSWAGGEPNNLGGENAMIWWSTPGSGRWNDVNGDSFSFGFIVEYDTPVPEGGSLGILMLASMTSLIAVKRKTRQL